MNKYLFIYLKKWGQSDSTAIGYGWPMNIIYLLATMYTMYLLSIMSKYKSLRTLSWLLQLCDSWNQILWSLCLVQNFISAKMILSIYSSFYLHFILHSASRIDINCFFYFLQDSIGHPYIHVHEHALFVLHNYSFKFTF